MSQNHAYIFPILPVPVPVPKWWEKALGKAYYNVEGWKKYAAIQGLKIGIPCLQVKSLFSIYWAIQTAYIFYHWVWSLSHTWRISPPSWNSSRSPLDKEQDTHILDKHMGRYVKKDLGRFLLLFAYYYWKNSSFKNEYFI